MLVPTTVAVDVHGEDAIEAEALQRWLSVRLLQEGYDVGPSSERAEATVTVHEHAGATRVEARGARGRRSFTVEDGPAPVRRLEVLHRALLGVDATSEPDLPLPRGRALAVRFEGEVDEEMLAALTGAARARGVVIALQSQPGDVLACIAGRGDLAEIGLGPAEDGCAPASVVVSRGAEIGAGATDVLAEVDRLLAPPSPVLLEDVLAPGAELIERPVPAVVREVDDLVAMRGPPRAEARFGVDGGIVGRGAVDAVMRAFARLGKYEGIGGRLELSVIPSGAPSVRVVDTVLAVGPDWQIDLHDRVRLHLGATVGADVQTYTIADSSAADVGWVAGIPAELSFRVRSDTRIHLAVNAAMTGVARSHRLGDDIEWERTPWRVGVALGFSHGWRIE